MMIQYTHNETCKIFKMFKKPKNPPPTLPSPLKIQMQCSKKSGLLDTVSASDDSPTTPAQTEGGFTVSSGLLNY